MATRRLGDEQALEVLRRLLRLTERKEIRWNAAEGSEHWFYADARNLGYSLDSRDRDDRHPIDLRVWTRGDPWDPEAAEVVAQVSSDDRHISAGTAEFFERLYRQVKGRVMSADDVFDAIVSDLSSLEEPF